MLCFFVCFFICLFVFSFVCCFLSQHAHCTEPWWRGFHSGWEIQFVSTRSGSTLREVLAHCSQSLGRSGNSSWIVFCHWELKLPRQRRSAIVRSHATVNWISQVCCWYATLHTKMSGTELYQKYHTCFFYYDWKVYTTNSIILVYYGRINDHANFPFQ